MKQTQLIMGMPVTLEIVDKEARPAHFDEVFSYLRHIDEVFSTYKNESEISKINRREIKENEYSQEMKEVFKLAEETKNETRGYFNIETPSGSYDPSGLVKGWAIYNASTLLKEQGVKNFCLEVAGDIQTAGENSLGLEWSIGIENPFNRKEIIKVIYPRGQGVATSGNYIRGPHIYNPHTQTPAESELVSLTVIGPNVYEADRFATAAFAMGAQGINFIESLPGFEGYAVIKSGTAVKTNGFEQYTHA